MFRILSIDGGGIRGIIPACVLAEVERAIQSLEPSRKIGDAFDMIAGTSTGGILACILLAPDPADARRARFSAADALQLYLENGETIFRHSLWRSVRDVGGLFDERYPPGGLEAVLARYFGDLELSRLVKPCLITAFDTQHYRPFFFTQADAVRSPANDYLVRDVARSTSAAPTYFPPALAGSLGSAPEPAPMVDGGVFANNPAACALVEAFKIDGGPSVAEDVAILSLGTGRQPASIPYERCRDWGAAQWAKPVIDLMLEGVAQTVDYQLAMLFQSMRRDAQYLRIDGVFGDAGAGLDVPDLNPAMDDAAPDNMARLQLFGERLAQSRAGDVRDFARKFLVDAG